MATNEKNLVTSFNTQITDIVNTTIEPAVNYTRLVEVSLESVGYDYTGSTINKFNKDDTYKNSFVVNYINLQKKAQ